MTDEEMDELLGAYALDAVNEDEQSEIEAYLNRNPRARAEVMEHREVATYLASTGSTAPIGLWDKIAGSLDERAPAPEKILAPVLRLDQQRELAARRRRSPWLITGLVAVAAAAAIGILAIRLNNRNNDLDRFRSESPAAQLATAASTAMATPTARKAHLVSIDGSQSVDVAIEGSMGYLVPSHLDSLTGDRTYQLWGLIDQNVISLGVIGNSPHVIAFPADSRLTTLMLTNETAGGVSVSTQQPIIRGNLSS